METNAEPFENILSSRNILEDSNLKIIKNNFKPSIDSNLKLGKGKTINAFKNLKNKNLNDIIFNFENSVGSSQSKSNLRFSKKLSRNTPLRVSRGKSRLRRVHTHDIIKNTILNQIWNSPVININNKIEIKKSIENLGISNNLRKDINLVYNKFLF
jgi:hypothetical protein